MNRTKRGAVSFEQIILFILAILVLALVASFFTGTFNKLTGIVKTEGVGHLEKGIACNKLCSAGKIKEYTSNGCVALLEKECTPPASS